MGLQFLVGVKISRWFVHQNVELSARLDVCEFEGDDEQIMRVRRCRREHFESRRARTVRVMVVRKRTLAALLRSPADDPRVAKHPASALLRFAREFF